MNDQALTAALEDYLETIYRLQAERGVVRVKDICAERDVKAGSVTPAMRRLLELDLIRQQPRGRIELTPRGEHHARKVFARHDLLVRFFTDVLKMEPHAAEADACAMEHHLSDAGMDRFTRLFEFLQQCEHGGFIEHFHRCSKVHPEIAACDPGCAVGGPDPRDEIPFGRAFFPLTDLPDGQSAVVARVTAVGDERRTLLDSGFVAQTPVTMESGAGDTLRVRIQGHVLPLSRAQAAGVLVVRGAGVPSIAHTRSAPRGRAHD